MEIKPICLLALSPILYGGLNLSGVMMHLQRAKQSTHDSTLRALELCVGAGGLALAAARSGFRSVTAVDVHGPACETLRRNKLNGVGHVRDWEILEADIRDMSYSGYTDIDLLSGGPPCQPFSHAGKKQGRADVREMFPEFIRAVRECRPKAFVLENVKGLHNSSFFNYFNYIVNQLRFSEQQRRKNEKWTQHRQRLERLYTSGKTSDTHYKVIYQVLNGANFGVGQHRERVFIVGVRADLGIEYGFPLPTHSRDALWHEQWVTGSYWEMHGISARRRPPIPAAVSKWLSTPPAVPKSQ
ncbi:MAG: DNA cytosine methyltransferase, partial [Candidatus Hydrogenedentales bacterium]